MGLCRPHSPDRGGPGAPLPGPGWTHCGQQRAEGVRRGDEAGRRCTGQGPGGSVPVTLRARPPPRSGTVQGLKLPARVAARVQGSQIPLGGPRVGGVQERERERVASTPGWGPGRGRLRGPGHSAGGVTAGSPWHPGSGRSRRSRPALLQGTGGPLHARAVVLKQGDRQPLWPPCPLQHTASRRPARALPLCTLLLFGTNTLCPPFPGFSPGAEGTPGRPGAARAPRR